MVAMGNSDNWAHGLALKFVGTTSTLKKEKRSLAARETMTGLERTMIFKLPKSQGSSTRSVAPNLPMRINGDTC